jgi:hypothetical protein
LDEIQAVRGSYKRAFRDLVIQAMDVIHLDKISGGMSDSKETRLITSENIYAEEITDLEKGYSGRS